MAKLVKLFIYSSTIAPFFKKLCHFYGLNRQFLSIFAGIKIENSLVLTVRNENKLLAKYL